MGSGERGGAETEAMHHARYEGGRWSSVDATVIRESAFRIHVNGLELATLLCTPADLDHLALGFLRSEGIIESVDDIRLLKLCPSGTCVDVWLRRANFEPPTRA